MPERWIDADGRFTSFAVEQEAPSDHPTLRSHRIAVGLYDRTEIVDKALQMFGGYGYLRDYPIERFWRDLRVHSILEGTNQVMRMIVGRDLLRQ